MRRISIKSADFLHKWVNFECEEEIVGEIEQMRNCCKPDGWAA